MDKPDLSSVAGQECFQSLPVNRVLTLNPEPVKFEGNHKGYLCLWGVGSQKVRQSEGTAFLLPEHMPNRIMGRNGPGKGARSNEDLHDS